MTAAWNSGRSLLVFREGCFMRILMFSWEYPPRVIGGLARHVHELAGAMARCAEVHVITC
ncbi:MAG: glycogen/starch synthase, partial [Bacillota bacterium]